MKKWFLVLALLLVSRPGEAQFAEVLTGSGVGGAYVTTDRVGYQTWNKIRLNFDQLNTFFKTGTGSPNTVVTAAVGALYFRTDGGSCTTLYIKESGAGNTGWVAHCSTGTAAGSTGDLQVNSSGAFAALTPASGISTFLATPTSANLRSALTDEVGTGAAYFVGGALGTPASGTASNLTGLPLTGLVAASDDQTVVSSGSAFVAKTLPSCTDTGGNHLNYDQSTNAFSCGTSGGVVGSLADGDYGDVTVSGSGATFTVDNSAITLAKIANAAANSKLLCSGASGSGSAYSECTLGTNLSMSGTTLNASGGGGGGSGSGTRLGRTQTGTMATGTTALPIDNTIPQNTEGDEYMTLTVTPSNATYTLHIEVVFSGAPSFASWVGVAVFQDSTANAIAAMPNYQSTNGASLVTTFSWDMTAGTTSATTFKVRAGTTGGITLTFNGGSGNQFYGGVAASSITITEIVP